MDFGIRVITSFEITNDITLYLTETHIVMWIVMLAMITFAVVVKFKSKKWEAASKPTGLQNVVEYAVSSFDNFFKRSAGDRVMHMAPWGFTVFVFLVLANTIGITGMRPPTADWAMTFPLALTSLIMIQYAGIKHRPKNYIKGLFAPIFIFFPINLLGELSKPVALSFRLFGNVLGGVILISILYGMAPFVLRLGLPVPLHAYFDIAAGILQAFIFTVLSITFVGMAAED